MPRGPLILCHRLSVWEQVPAHLLTVTGCTNVLYGCYSGVLAERARRGLPPSRMALRALVLGNGAWAIVCPALAAATWSYSSWLGTAHLGGEGLFVGALSYVESRVFPRQNAR